MRQPKKSKGFLCLNVPQFLLHIPRGLIDAAVPARAVSFNSHMWSTSHGLLVLEVEKAFHLFSPAFPVHLGGMIHFSTMSISWEMFIPFITVWKICLNGNFPWRGFRSLIIKSHLTDNCPKVWSTHKWTKFETTSYVCTLPPPLPTFAFSRLDWD